MLIFCVVLQDDELDISPVEIDDALVIEDDDISDDDEDVSSYNPFHFATSVVAVLKINTLLRRLTSFA